MKHASSKGDRGDPGTMSSRGSVRGGAPGPGGGGTVLEAPSSGVVTGGALARESQPIWNIVSNSLTGMMISRDDKI